MPYPGPERVHRGSSPRQSHSDAAADRGIYRHGACAKPFRIAHRHSFVRNQAVQALAVTVRRRGMTAGKWTAIRRQA